MVKILLVIDNGEIREATDFKETAAANVKWFWVDFSEPTSEEIRYLTEFFHFHELAVEDCMNQLQRPKLDDYGDYRFFVLHSLSDARHRPDEVNVFVAERYLVSFHMHPSADLEFIYKELQQRADLAQQSTDHLLYRIIDRFVDQYFPILYKVDDELEQLETKNLLRPTQRMVHRVFRLRRELYSIRRSLEPYRDVVKEIMYSKDPRWKTQYKFFYADIHDHLTRLLEMTDSYLQMGKDLLESYTSLSSEKMNRVMVTLTIITTIFMPLTFIAGIYGMNFENMPELKWQYGYYSVLGGMAVIAVLMVLWFRRKGWFQ